MLKRRNRIRPYLAPLSIGVLGAVVSAEWILSIGAAGPLTIPFYNRLYPYVMFRPHENTRFVSHDVTLASNIMSRNQRVVHHFTNEDGLRIEALDYDLSKQKPSGQWRAAVLGSSAVQLGTTYEDSLPGALRTVLRRRHPGRDIEVVNAGIQSAVSRQTIAHLLFTVKDYNPDLVILYDGFNDLMLPLNYESRPNFPYNFQTLEAAWEQYRNEHQAPPWRLIAERSYLYQGLRARFSDGEERKRGLYVGPNALSPEEILHNSEWVRNHVTAYLSNWEKLIELSRVYGFRVVCVLQPTAVLDDAFGPRITAQGYGLDEGRAEAWVGALGFVYEEASRQVEELHKRRVEASILDFSRALSPAEEHFWDVVHVYDETNLLLAEKLLARVEALRLLEAGERRQLAGPRRGRSPTPGTPTPTTSDRRVEERPR